MEMFDRNGNDMKTGSQVRRKATFILSQHVKLSMHASSCESSRNGGNQTNDKTANFVLVTARNEGRAGCSMYAYHKINDWLSTIALL